MPVTLHLPHSSVRRLLTYTAPTSSIWRESAFQDKYASPAPIGWYSDRMVIDPACSVVFEAEQEEEDVMSRPPRDPQMPLLIRERIGWAVIQGLVALVLLAGLLIGGAQMDIPEDDLRALVFGALVLFNMGLILINRSFRASLSSAFLRPNRSLWILLTAVSITLAIAVGWPPVQQLFSFGKFHFNEFFVAIALSIVSLLLLEAIKSFWFRKT